MRVLDQNASAARFLLGGIGTGNISLDQNARLCDFELWNKPNKNFYAPYTFFAVRAENPDGESCIKALESQLAGPFPQSHGFDAKELGGLPRFRRSEMTGETPFVTFKLTDPDFPLEAGLTAFTPFIPLATDDSSLPAAVLRYSVKNTSGTPLTVSVAGSMMNFSCFDGFKEVWRRPGFEGKSLNRYVGREESRGIHFTPAEKPQTAPDYFETALLTTETEGISCLEYWNEGSWFDGLQDFWNDFSADGELTSGRTLRGGSHTINPSFIPMASLCVKKTVGCGEEAVFEFVISWYCPNRYKSWDQSAAGATGDCACGCDCKPQNVIRNYYAKHGSALESASYLINNLPRLEGQSRMFANALKTGIPEEVSEAISATATVLRSTTCFRVEDGTFFGWEGCFDTAGCCDGNCTHVWNYTQMTAFLFPELERSMRGSEFIYETEEDGRMAFRAGRYFNADHKPWDMPAADGQLGAVIRLYRDWKLCGDDGWLKQMWPGAKRALEYAFTRWDTDGDGLMDGQQHNTYDIEFYGVSSMLNAIFYAALRAGEEIERYFGNEETAALYAGRREKGAQKLDALTFNGEYFEQVIDDVNEHKYQYGKGCLSDQLLGQQLAHVSRLGYLLDKDHVRSAVQSIYKYNFRENFHNVTNLQRTYALNDDAGLLLCSWPKGGRPEIPFVYCDEVWSGIEYHVASHLIYEGFAEEGLKLVRAVRNRHDGTKRSPWNEVECGHHYARSLASYGVLLALTGFHCDAVNKVLSFNPAVNKDGFAGFFCCPAGWGLAHIKGPEVRLEVMYGDLSGYKAQVC
jgi:uncharacterized protein (DUF608 family)